MVDEFQLNWLIVVRKLSPKAIKWTFNMFNSEFKKNYDSPNFLLNYLQSILNKLLNYCQTLPN
jgi:hypothetical protein